MIIYDINYCVLFIRNNFQLLSLHSWVVYNKINKFLEFHIGNPFKMGRYPMQKQCRLSTLHVYVNNE